MSVSFQAIYRNGVFVPIKRPKIKLREGQAVELSIQMPSSDESDPAFKIAELAVDTGIPDLAHEHDHYLYGTPKRGKKNGRKNKLR